jgi:lipoprotein-anchoring transpeptidase ErfK/SrfK
MNKMNLGGIEPPAWVKQEEGDIPPPPEEPKLEPAKPDGVLINKSTVPGMQLGPKDELAWWDERYKNDEGYQRDFDKSVGNYLNDSKSSDRGAYNKWYRGKYGRQGDISPFVDTMYYANAGLRHISELHAQGQQEDYIQANTANPLANLGFNDGRSEMVEHGYEQFAKGGNVLAGAKTEGQIMAMVNMFKDGGSIVDFMTEKGQDASFSNRRKEFYKKFGSSERYRGTAEQNIALLDAMKTAKPTSYSTSQYAQRKAESKVEPKKTTAASKKTTVAPSNSSLYNRRTPNAGKLAANFKDQGLSGTGSSWKDYNQPKAPQSGVVVDKRTGKAYVTQNGKTVKEFNVLTGKNVDLNTNTASMNELDRDPNKRATPIGPYIMNPNQIYGSQGYNLNPINAYGMNAPQASGLGLHDTYDKKNRNQFYGTDKANQSYGCINADCSDIADVFNMFPKGDTLMVIDSKMPQFKSLAKKLGQKRYGGKNR